jgi:hypothetical protein
MRQQTQAQAPVALAPVSPAAGKPGWLLRVIGENVFYFTLFALLCVMLAILRLPVHQMYDPNTGSWRVAPSTLPNLLPILLAVPAIIYLNTLVHEGGHLLAALLTGFWVYRVRIGPLALTRRRGGLRLGLIRERTLGGDVLCFPRDDAHLLPRRALISLAGPLASLALAAVAWSLFRHYDLMSTTPLANSAGVITTTQGDVTLADLFFCVTLYALGSGPGNLLPLRERGHPTDGMTLLRMLTEPDKMERETLVAIAYGMLLRGIRPRDWPITLVRRAVFWIPDGSEVDVRASIMAYSQALDAGDIPSARRYLVRFLAPTPTRQQSLPTLALEAAYFMARHDGNPALARAWLVSGNGSPYDAYMRPRAEAAILLAEGRAAEAHARAAAGLDALLRRRPALLADMFLEEDNLRELLALSAPFAVPATDARP